MTARGDRMSRAPRAGGWRFVAALMALALVSACAGPARMGLRETPCWFDNTGANPATCGWLRPAEQGSHGVVELPVVVLRARSQAPADGAVVVLNGGPGAGSDFDGEGVKFWRMRRALLGLRQDFVIYDQRGSGLSRPALACPFLDEMMRDEQAHAHPYAERMARFYRSVEDCAAQVVPLADRRAGLYSTRTAVADLLELIDQLKSVYGYRTVSLYGASYGTRLAIAAAQRPDAGIDRMVLDSLYPPGVSGFHKSPKSIELELHQIERRCVRQGCRWPEGGLRPLLGAAMDRLDAQPILTEVSDPERVGQRIPVRLDGADLYAIVAFSLYDEAMIERLPDMLGKLAAGQADPQLQGWLEMLTWMSLYMDFNAVANTLIRCHDEPSDAAAPAMSADDFVARLRIAADQAAGTRTLCDRLDVLNEPLPSDWRVRQPTLILNMAADPSTPVQDARAARHRFDRGHLIVVDGGGHGVIDLNPSAAALAGRFLDGEVSLKALAKQRFDWSQSQPARAD